MNRLVRALFDLEAEAHERGWDQPPRLYALLPEGPALVPIFVMDNDLRYPDVLASVAEQKRKKLRKAFPTAWGWADVSEGWRVVVPNDPLEQEMTLAMQEEHRLFEHKSRQETRVVTGATRSQLVTVHRIRGLQPEVFYPSGTHHFSGTMMDAMRELARTR